MMTNIAAKPLSRALIATLLALGFVAATPAVASAAKAAPVCVATGDYASTMNLTVNPPTARAGDQVIISGTGYPPNCDLTVVVDGQTVGTVTTDGEGNFELPWTIPAGTDPGSLDITTSVSDIVKHATLEVVADGTGPVTPPPPGGTDLPRTGSDVLPLVAGGVALMVLGSLVVLSTRKRSANHA